MPVCTLLYVLMLLMHGRVRACFISFVLLGIVYIIFARRAALSITFDFLVLLLATSVVE